ncbi:MAG: flagellar protein FlaG [Bryobacteraceae bacterium]
MNSGSIELRLQPPVAVPATPITPEIREEQRQLIQAIRAINRLEVFGENSEITFAFDRESRRAIVRIIDTETREVIRQIPAEYILRMAEHLRTNAGGF